MLRDLRRALARKPEERRWGMVIDTRRCIGCHACTVACVAENNLPSGVTYRRVFEDSYGDYPDVRTSFMPTNCMQCEKPPCVEAANRVVPGAMGRTVEGVVTIDYAKMKGREVFEVARKACPYTALYLDEGRNHTDGTPAVQDYETRPVPEYGRTWTRGETKGSTRKCHFCLHRVDAGRLPACVSTCTGLAMQFGDLADPKSLVSERVATGACRRLHPDKGTSPRVHFLDDWPAEDEKEAPPPLSNRPRQDCLRCHEFGR
ncbi:MAG: 4Fe-4S dicluster domain-containing protein [Planctomycetaceae bacterium]|nr:4Fe-4S dicluster domain-containing protein [Planctomycetota bacterium]NUN51342.1 4Fe-4S dicluster domain-containing protein [Planctomycetaceae bacterium]